MDKQLSSPYPLLDPDDGVGIRSFLESLRSQMQGVRSMWDPQYDQLRAFFAPRNGRRDPSDVNNGARQDYYIINETGLLALRVLASGMLTGMSSQTRPWFRIKIDDPRFKDDSEVKAWCEQVAAKCRETMLKSNYYQTLLETYEAEGLYGTAAFLIEADPQTDIRCHPYPTGSYYLGCGDDLRVDVCVRELSMTARNLVEKFGVENVSDSVKTINNSNAGGVRETYYPVAHAIMKGSYFGPSKTNRQVMPWVSIWYEMGQYNTEKGILRRSGFMENPLIAGRWKTIGENIYGESPAMDILGSTMSLQAWEERIAQAAEKQFNPPMIATTGMDPRKLTTLPGEFSFVNEKDVSKAFAPAYQVDFKLAEGMKLVQQIEQRINDGMFRSVFQMFSDSDRREITAEEIRAKQVEKMQVLGPVVERNVDEILAPSVQRILSILQRIPGKLPPMPASLRAADGQMIAALKLEFESVLAAAARMSVLNNINQVMTFAGQEAALNQGILDNFDMDKVARTYGDAAGIPSDLMRTPDQVAALRADKQRAQQQQMMAENAQKLAAAAQTASQTPAGSGTLLEKVAPGLAGGDEG